MKTTNRRQFLASLGKGAGAAAVAMAFTHRFARAGAIDPRFLDGLTFGALEPLVDTLQATPPDRLLDVLVASLRSGTPLKDLVAAGALANSRAFGGTHYDGYHAFMALAPSFEMAQQMPEPLRALPVLKVLHRNSRFIHAAGAAEKDSMGAVDATGADRELVAHARRRDLAAAERSLAALIAESRSLAYDELQTIVRDEMNVHRVVLSWRAFDTLRLAGEPHALTLLRQSLRFCVDEDAARVQRGLPESPLRELLPSLLDEYELEGREPGRTSGDDAWLEGLSGIVMTGSSAEAARAVAQALAEGHDPESVGAAISLAATRLVLHDPGRDHDAPGRPTGSVHGASIGVHASDAANAWRNIARVGSSRNAFASLIAAGYHTGGQSTLVGTEPYDHDAAPSTLEDPNELLGEIEARIRERDQRGASVATRRYCELGHSADELFAKLLPLTISEDGALHGEKYFRTVQEEHSAARPAHRAPYLVALARVTASAHGVPAPGVDEARKLLTA